MSIKSILIDMTAHCVDAIDTQEPAPRNNHSHQLIFRIRRSFIPDWTTAHASSATGCSALTPA